MLRKEGVVKAQVKREGVLAKKPGSHDSTHLAPHCGAE